MGCAPSKYEGAFPPLIPKVGNAPFNKFDRTLPSDPLFKHARKVTKIVGRAAAAATIESPIAGTPCCFWECEVEALSADNMSWAPRAATARRARGFRLVDDSGAAVAFVRDRRGNPRRFPGA